MQLEYYMGLGLLFQKTGQPGDELEHLIQNLSHGFNLSKPESKCCSSSRHREPQTIKLFFTFIGKLIQTLFSQLRIESTAVSRLWFKTHEAYRE
jgi:hypothetical protein